MKFATPNETHADAWRNAQKVAANINTFRAIEGYHNTSMKVVEIDKVERTSAGLRDALFDELDELRNGRSDPGRANAVAKLATSVIATVTMEMDVQAHNETRMKGISGAKLESLGVPIVLGSEE